MDPTAVVRLGMLTPIGLSSSQTASAARAGISRVRESSIMDEYFDPVVMGFLEEEHLPPLAQELPGADRLTYLQGRLLRLAAPALAEAVGDLKSAQGLPLFLALPSFPKDVKHPVPDSFLELLARQSNVRLDLKNSALFRNGRAGFFMALTQAVEKVLQAGPKKMVLVGGVDSYLDLYLLAHFNQIEKRILSRTVRDGFRPGEGAAFFLLAAPQACEQQHLTPLASLAGIGLGTEEGHLGSDAPYRGEGLAQAFAELFDGLKEDHGKIATVYAGFNGESFFSKEWGVSFLRNRDRFEAEHQLEHPAECIGDAGAALAPVMMGCATVGLAKGHLRSPALVWASSDGSERGAALLAAPKK